MTRSPLRRTRGARRPAPRREGAVMLVVMLILLVSTATAMFAIHSTAHEVRASGHMRRAMQTQYVGESGVIAGMAWIDHWGPQALLKAMSRTAEMHRTSGDPILDMAPFHEPELADGKEGYRLVMEDLALPGGSAVLDRDALGGTRQVFEPAIYLDVYDNYTFTGAIAGHRSDGKSRLRFLLATYTSRGRSRIPTGDFDSGVTGDRPYHEGASDARAHGLTGPYGQ